MFNFWHSGTLALTTERQSARMSQIKHGGLDQYGAEPFEQLALKGLMSSPQLRNDARGIMY